MNNRLTIVVLLAVGIAPGRTFGAGATTDTTPLLQVHLPRQVTVEGSLLTLGQVSVVKGDPNLAAAASAISLGRLSMPGQKAVLDRLTILSRLASHGIPMEKVRLTGAETVMIRRYSKRISTEEFVEVSKEFLRQHPPGPMVAETIPMIRPKELVLEGQVEDLQLTPRFVRSGSRGHVTVQIAVMTDGKTVGVRDIPFRLKYQSRRIVAITDIPEGTPLTPENVRIETVLSDQPQPMDWKPPYGQVATRALAADTEIRADMVGVVQPLIVIRRNETVVIRVERPGLVVTAVGTALQEARAGEYVKVRNEDSRRVIVCKVNADGTVEPML